MPLPKPPRLFRLFWPVCIPWLLTGCLIDPIKLGRELTGGSGQPAQVAGIAYEQLDAWICTSQADTCQRCTNVSGIPQRLYQHGRALTVAPTDHAVICPGGGVSVGGTAR